ncbi:hypothetical protein K8I61_05495 [bacterium]|nr:hypothetical protein [bacterium]
MLANTDRGITTGGPYDGAGADLDAPYFLAFNMTPGAYEITGDANGHFVLLDLPSIPASAVGMAEVVFPESVFQANPTGTWCTE